MKGYEHPETIVCPGGPLLLRGRHVVTGRDGETHETTRPVTAVCRCDRSALFPWCDGTHKVLPERLRPS
ncbi:CDGSH iron-sulfur domain-containing protein [Nocardioides mangrovi]|uniref:CDGSH iron-sulfur domain-containing protein n=1 Tax=Nocardioides mangrovi TaxID=2874580 RepID=A0ABS7UDU8_9ACTN|nr:CDGSH iron-sulfur domain-containing protein [Nocardioides mangrovi]MBZ5739164.1 CDGSH iron-sulfur domain-containing protein [Nocardioides mangrovi]